MIIGRKSHLKNTFSVELLYHKHSNMFRPLNKVKPCNSSHFLIPLIFRSLLCQPCSIRYFLSIPFLILEIKKKCVQLRVTIPEQGQQHVLSAQQSQATFGVISTWMGDQIRIPRFVIRVVHIMLTIFTIMLILYAHKMLLLCSKSPTIMLKIYARITHFLPKIKYSTIA